MYGRTDMTSNSRSIRSSPRQWPNKYHKTRITLLGAHQCLRSFPSVPSINIPSAVGFSTQITTLGVIINKITFDSDVSVVCKKSFFYLQALNHTRHALTYIYTPHTQPFYGLFPGPTGWAGARRELLDFMVQRKINRGRHNDHPAGRHSIWTNQCPLAPDNICTTKRNSCCRPKETNNILRH